MKENMLVSVPGDGSLRLPDGGEHEAVGGCTGWCVLQGDDDDDDNEDNEE